MSAPTRATPLYCPYCGEEDLRPDPEHHAGWRCRCCARAFTVALLGLTRPEGRGSDDVG